MSFDCTYSGPLASFPPLKHRYLHKSLARHSGMDAGLVRAHSESSATDGCFRKLSVLDLALPS